MPDSAHIKIAPLANRLDQATNEETLGRLISVSLEPLLGEERRVARVVIPRVLPLRDGSYAIQYFIIFDERREGFPPNLMLWGVLLNEEQEPPRYAEYQEVVLFWASLRLMIPLFPFDPELPALSGMWNLDWRRHDILAPRPFQLDEEVTFTPQRLLGYRFAKRCVIHGLLQSRNTMVPPESAPSTIKLLRPAAARRLKHNLETLAGLGLDGLTGHHLGTPKTYFTDLEPGIIVSEYVNDPSLHELIGDAEYHNACAAAGRLLKSVHAQSDLNLDSHTAEDELAMLGERIGRVANVGVEHVNVMRRTLERLSATAGIISDVEPRLSHRDFYDKQVLYSSSRTTLVDCDTLQLADPALDYGNFLAHQFLRGIQMSKHKSSTNGGAESFMIGYGTQAHGFKNRVNWWRTASLLRLATIYCLRPSWRRLTPDLLAEAEAHTQRD
ncbi:MAG TPA: hypothetical protein VLB27_09555 [candidate division Zixibacteria bacterium]|nr:hypothetical protein [candidate division Zixibacteria bacterium]